MILRDYQQSVFDALIKENKNLLLWWPRRSGKSSTSVEIAKEYAKQKHHRVILYFCANKSMMSSALENIENDSYFKKGNRYIYSCIANNSLIHFIIPPYIYNPWQKIDLIIWDEPLFITQMYGSEIAQLYDGSRYLGAGRHFPLQVICGTDEDNMEQEYRIRRCDDQWHISQLSVEDTKHVPLEEILDEVKSELIIQECHDRDWYPGKISKARKYEN